MVEKENNAYNLIISYRDYYGTYHHHKEQMAFSGTGLFLAGVTALIFRDPSTNTLPWEVPTLLIVAGLAIFFFIAWQFELRRYAANMVDSCTNLAAIWLNNLPSLESDDLSPKFYNNNCFPKALVCEFERIKDSRNFFASAVFSEVLTYLIMLILTFIALCSLNFSCVGEVSVILMLIIMFVLILFKCLNFKPTKDKSAKDCPKVSKLDCQ